MIVRERNDTYVMIKQHHHAQISGAMACRLDQSFFGGETFKPSVQYAAAKHDDAWQMIDKQPFWNDKKHEPYRFTDFPNAAKTVFYKHGVDNVQQHDAYAALLCSEHYRRFLQNDLDQASQQFVEQEKRRQQTIIQKLDEYDDDLFHMHYGLLQFLDSLSLYICMNEPGARKDQEHPFFKHGIPVSPSLGFCQTDKVSINWQDSNTAAMEKLPFNDSVTSTIQQKRVSKHAIAEHGLIQSYEQADLEEVSIQLVQS